MKVLMIAHNATVEGAGIAFKNVVEALSESGIYIVAVVPGYHGVYELLNDIKGVKRYVIPEIKNEAYPSLNGFIDVLKYLPKIFRHFLFRSIFRKKLYKIVLLENPDIIHSNTGTIRIGAEISQFFNIPHVWHIRECQKLGCGLRPYGGEKKVEKLFHEYNNHCIAITKSVFSYYNLDRIKDRVIYDGVFSDLHYDFISDLPKEKIILYVGLLSKEKGITMLISAFEKIYELIPSYQLWIVGIDAMGINNIIKKNKSYKQIKYLGFRKDVYSLMSRAKTVVVTSNYEGFGFITAEAMFNHALVIGRDKAGTKEQMDNAAIFSGFEVALRFKTVDELSDKILEVAYMKDTDYSDRTKKAFEVVTKLYTVKRNAQEILDFYNSILKK